MEDKEEKTCPNCQRMAKENEILRRHIDIDDGLFIPPTKSDEILRCAEIYERCEILSKRVAELEQG